MIEGCIEMYKWNGDINTPGTATMVDGDSQPKVLAKIYPTFTIPFFTMLVEFHYLTAFFASSRSVIPSRTA